VAKEHTSNGIDARIAGPPFGGLRAIGPAAHLHPAVLPLLWWRTVGRPTCYLRLGAAEGPCLEARLLRRRLSMLPLGALFAFIGRSLGRILSMAFAWATTALWGRVPKDKELVLAAMSASALLWPVMIAGALFPSVAGLLLAFVTVPDWAEGWVRPTMIALAILLPLFVGLLSSRLRIHPPPPTQGKDLLGEILRGYPNTLGLFIVLAWMMVLAPLVKLHALLRRWESAHVPITIEPDGYETVVRDLQAALREAGIDTVVRQANWVFEVPGRILALLGGPRVRALVPERLMLLRGRDLEIVIHPMDLAFSGKQRLVARARAATARELTFTAAHQTWTTEAQRVEDELARAARGETDIEAVGKRIASMDLDYEQWEVLYRLLLQVRLRKNPVGTDAVDAKTDPVPPLRTRLAGIISALRRLWPPRGHVRATR
jgi:hypothetical protein